MGSGMTEENIPASHAEQIESNLYKPIPDEEGKDYSLRSSREIQRVLQSLIDHKALITAYFNTGNDFLMTSMLEILEDDDEIILDVSNHPEMNQRVLSTDRIICVALLDKIKIQFVLAGVRTTQFENRSAFLADLPQSVLRLQRRESYRLTLPVLQPLIGITQLKTSDGKIIPAEVHIVDISGGGVGIVSKSNEVELRVGMALENCRIDLPGIGTLTVTLVVRSVYELILKTGIRQKRAGCQFLDLSGQQDNLLQRYIIKIERDRKARDSGME